MVRNSGSFIWLFSSNRSFGSLCRLANKQRNSNKYSLVSVHNMYIPERRSLVGGLFEERMHESLWLLATVFIWGCNSELLRRDICFCGALLFRAIDSKLCPELRWCCSPKKESFILSEFSAKYKWSFPLF